MEADNPNACVDAESSDHNNDSEFQATGELSSDQASTNSSMEVDDVISSGEASSMEINPDQSSSEQEMNTDSSDQSVSDEDDDQTSIHQNLVANIEVQEENDRLLKIKKEFEERKKAIQKLSKKNARPMTIDQFMGPFGYPYFGSDFLDKDKWTNPLGTASRTMKDIGWDVFIRAPREYFQEAVPPTGADDVFLEASEADNIRQAVRAVLHQKKKAQLQSERDQLKESFDALMEAGKSKHKGTRAIKRKLQDAEDELLAEPIEDDELFNDTKTLENPDWKAISKDYLNDKYGAYELSWLFFHKVLPVKAKTGKWPTVERNKLKSFMKKPANQKLQQKCDWDGIAKLFGVECKALNGNKVLCRSGFDVMSQFQQKSNWNSHRPRCFTAEESAEFLLYVEKVQSKLLYQDSSLIPWKDVAKNFPGRSRIQLYTHWNRKMAEMREEAAVEPAPSSSGHVASVKQPAASRRGRGRGRGGRRGRQ